MNRGNVITLDKLFEMIWEKEERRDIRVLAWTGLIPLTITE